MASLPSPPRLAQPSASHESRNSSMVERLEESASRMSMSSQAPPALDHNANLEAQLMAHLARGSSVRSTGSSRLSAHSSLVPTPLNVGPLPTAARPASPSASSRSFSWSQASNQRSRANSRHYTGRGAPIPEPDQEGRPLDSLLGRSTGMHSRKSSRRSDYQPLGQDVSAADEHERPLGSNSDAPMRTASTVSRSSTLQGARSLFRDFDGTHYTQLDDEIAEEEEGDEYDGAGPGDDYGLDHASSRMSYDNGYTPLAADDHAQPVPDLDHSEEFVHEHGRDEPRDMHTPRAELTASEAFPQPAHETSGSTGASFTEERRMSALQVLEQPRTRAPQWAVPPPEEGMVYYPAPVPMTLNLPKRLSKVPAPNVQHQRRSQLLTSLPKAAHQSTPWLPPLQNLDYAKDEPPVERPKMVKRHSAMPDLAKLPPQLRASLFFDQQPVAHDVEVQQESAVMTLESLLDASASTPVGVPAKPHTHVARRSTFTALDELKADRRKSQLSLANPTVDRPVDTRSKSRLNLSTSSIRLAGVEEEGVSGHRDHREGDGGSDEQEPLHSHPEDGSAHVEDKDHGLDEYERQAQQELPFEMQPTTLLAELQLRKTELKSRNRTAVTAYPTGMHSTLLQLDAVAQVENRRRKGQKTHLAWEDPDAANPALSTKDDDDVPLGLLYPARAGLINKGLAAGEDQPLGLMERRAMEDNEPLSRRRNRILGLPSPKPQALVSTSPARRSPVPVIGVDKRPASGAGLGAEEDDEDEYANETLAQRTRRLRSSRVLDEAIGRQSGQHIRAVSDDFASEMMSQFGGLESVKAEAETGSRGSPPPEAEETLGQRRARLQAQREREHAARQVSGETSSSVQPRTALRSTSSLGNLLAENPMSRTRQAWDEQPARAGGLLNASEIAQANRRQALQDRNSHAQTAGLANGPLLSIPRGGKSAVDFRGEVAKERPMFARGQYNDGAGGARTPSPGPRQALSRQASNMSLGMKSAGGLNSYMQTLPTQGPPAYDAHQQPLSYARPPPPLLYPLDHDSGLHALERDKIDRWRQGVIQ